MAAAVSACSVQQLSQCILKSTPLSWLPSWSSALLQGEWVCPACTSGQPRAVQCSGSAHERFLQRKGLGLARIEAIWKASWGDRGAKRPAWPACQLVRCACTA